MSGLVGWMGRRADDDRSLERCSAALPGTGGETRERGTGGGGALALVAHGGWATDGRVAVAVAGDARWRPDESRPAAQAVLAAWPERGPDVLDDLAGPFAMAVVHLDGSRGLVATDRLGTRPLYYRDAGDSVAFATRLAALRPLEGVDDGWDPQAVFDYLYFHVVPGPETIHPGVCRLLPGECLVVTAGQAERHRWWRPVFAPSDDGLETLSAECMDALRRAVGRSAAGEDTGAFLSGGIDSSTVAGLLGEVQEGPASTFSIGFDAEGYDEMGYARITAKHFGTDQHEYYVTPEDVLDAMPKLAAHMDEPFGNSSAVPAYCCAKFAQEQGMARLLAGDGGDELFAGNTRYVKQRKFEWYGRLPPPLRRGLVEPLVLGVPGGDAVPLLSKVRAYVRQARIPLPERMETWNLLTRIGADAVLHPDLLGAVDAGRPQALLRDTWEGIDSPRVLDRMLALDWKFTLADNDLRKVDGAAELAGLPVRYPFLDDEVVDFSLRVPADLKLRGTRLRFFLKQALTGFLAPETLEKPKHGFGLPFGPWMVEHPGLSAFVGDALADLDGRGLLRRGFRATLVEDLLPRHPGYYGTLVWVLVMLELWFKARAEEGGRANST